MLIPLADDPFELAFSESAINQGHGNTMKGKVPGGIPRIFPIVRHRHDTFIVEMAPVRIAAEFAQLRRGWLGWIAIQPFFDNVVIELLVPKETGEGLPLNGPLFFVQTSWRKSLVEFICLLSTQIDRFIKSTNGGRVPTGRILS